MRAGGCTVQQALTVDAASVVKQSVALARRRGHAQVTPLHVASTMLAAPTGLLRTACLQSHSHPLQCKALELCFNVALNRLPTSTSSPMLGGHISPLPSISNALVAAFKRAQAHQRRGSIENQQQPILTVKIELEQLIISILDDPSVSRVMREASFSSTQVKSNVEQAVSVEICSKTPSSISTKPTEIGGCSPLVDSSSIQVKPMSKRVVIRNEDVLHVIDNLVKIKRRNFAVVGECLDTIDGVVKAVMEKVDKREVPEVLRDVKFITLSFSSFGNFNKGEVEQKLKELRNLVNSYIGEVILNLVDLSWVVESRGRTHENSQKKVGNFTAIEHMITEVGKLVCGLGGSSRLRLMSTATFQTYMRCKSGRPSLESAWCLHPLTIPAGSLRLSLVADSDLDSVHSESNSGEGEPRWLLSEDDNINGQPRCCSHCSASFEIEARHLTSSQRTSASNISTLPAWLRQYKHENILVRNDDKEHISITELRKKWNTICNSIHKPSYSPAEENITFSSSPHSSSVSGFSDERRHRSFALTNHDNPGIGNNFVKPEQSNGRTDKIEPDLRLSMAKNESGPRLAFPLKSTPTSNSVPTGDLMEIDYVHNYKEHNPEDLITLCDSLEKKVPWQKDIILDIVGTIMRCRSGMMARKGDPVGETNYQKKDTWLFFQGRDVEAKEKIARELARIIFGSKDSLVSIFLSNFSSPRTDSCEDNRNKRSRDEQSCSYVEKFADAVSSNPHRVFFIDDVEQADYSSRMGFKRAIHRGRAKNSAGVDIYLSDAIIILSREGFSSRSRACSPTLKQRSIDSKGDQRSTPDRSGSSVSLDLNVSIDDDIETDQCIDDTGLIESVDKLINFRTQEP